jgi:hypothetical protein
MRSNENPFFPTIYELGYVGIATLAVLIAGNAKALLEHFGLISSSDVVGDRVSTTVGSGLKVIDAFSATPGLVTFITWGIIGLILFSLVQAFIRASGEIEFEREVGSSRFIHPANFRRDRYWRTILFNAFLSFGLIVFLLISIVLYILFVVPIASLYLQRFLILSTASRLLALLVSLFIISVGTFALYCILKAVLWQYRASHH